MGKIIKIRRLQQEMIFKVIADIDKPKILSNKIFIKKELVIKVIMDFRMTTWHKFKTRLGFKQN